MEYKMGDFEKMNSLRPDIRWEFIKDHLKALWEKGSGKVEEKPKKKGKK
jgi:hypothetical protein